MNGFTKDKEERLLEILAQELDEFVQIRGLTENQTELLAANDAEAFDKSLDRRQALIEKINGLHQESDILMQSYISFSSAPGGGKIDAVETAAGRLRDLIAQCAGINDKNIITAKENAEGYIKQIGKLSLSRKSIGAYVQGVPNDPELFDKMS